MREESSDLSGECQWHKRWQKLKTNQAPDFWVRFYAQKFGQSLSVSELYAWGQLLGAIKFALTEKALQALRSIYAAERNCLGNPHVETLQCNVSTNQFNQRAASLA